MKGLMVYATSFNKQNDGAYVMKGRTYLKHPWFIFCIDNKR